MAEINFTAPPTCAAFMKDPRFGRLIAGPVGSGKTTACIFELFRRSCEQMAAEDGYRYTRWAIVRQTLKQLKDTVLKDIEDKLQGIARYKVSDNTVYVEIGDVRSEWLLIPLDDPDDQRRLLSMQLTGAWLSEAIEMTTEIVPALSGRCGRYPSGRRGVPTWFGVIGDTNMPSEGSAWHKFMEEPTSDWGIFIQPGGLEENAENLNYLNQTPETNLLPIDHPQRLAQGRVYYERAARSNSPDWVLRYVHAQYGNDPSGTAVFRDSFKSSFHVAEGLEPSIHAPLLIGQDFGRDPCSIICQIDHRGRMLILEEVVAEDTGLELHLERSLKPVLMQERYARMPILLIGDPAGTAKSTLTEESSFDMLKRLGFRALPAPTNNIDARIRAIDSWLLKQSDGAGAILFDKDRCPKTIQGMRGGYRYARTRLGVRKPLPDKNEYSHIIDALQYACLASMSQMMNHPMMARHLGVNGPRERRPRPTAAGWT